MAVEGAAGDEPVSVAGRRHRKFPVGKDDHFQFLPVPERTHFRYLVHQNVGCRNIPYGIILTIGHDLGKSYRSCARVAAGNLPESQNPHHGRHAPVPESINLCGEPPGDEKDDDSRKKEDYRGDYTIGSFHFSPCFSMKIPRRIFYRLKRRKNSGVFPPKDRPLLFRRRTSCTWDIPRRDTSAAGPPEGLFKRAYFEHHTEGTFFH